VRVITATHRDLAAMVHTGAFRADLFYRLSVVPIELPALREVREDIPLIARHLCQQLQLNDRISAAAMAALQDYSWPGNVRELRNVLERAAVMCGDREIRPEDLRLPKTAAVPDWAPAPVWMPTSPITASLLSPVPVEPVSIPKSSGADARAHLKEMERQMIIEAMERNRGNKAAVARELGIPLSTLKRRIKEYQISDEE
jgi:DNA-binding NtrC family response regulator